MVRGFRFLDRRIALGLLAIVCTLTPVGCAKILGIDDGQPREREGGFDDATATSDAPADRSSDAPGHDAADVVRPRDVGPPDVDDAGETVEAGRDAAAGDGGDACVSDRAFCTNHCGTGPDNCNVTRQCADNCPANWTCDALTNQCACQSDPTWCTGRCNTTKDNCGATIDCGQCDGGVACNSSNTCGCTPQADPCGMRQCGQTLDSCNHPVTCGNNGLCAGGGICNQAAGTCCTPIGNPCANRCQTSVDDGCGRPIGCPPSCSLGEVCDQTVCCTAPQCGNSCNVTSLDGCGNPMPCTCSGADVCYQGLCCTPQPGCSPTCVDNCGRPAPCCPPSDGGADGGGCGALSDPCTGAADCCSGACNGTGMCVSSCSTTSCMMTSDCCYGLTCFTPIGLEGGAGPMPQGGLGHCQ